MAHAQLVQAGGRRRLGLLLLGLLLARPEEGLEVTSAGTVGAVHVDVASE